MPLELNTSQMIGKGALAVIFSDDTGTLVYKLFRQQPEDEPNGFRRMIFTSELRAAEIANHDEETRGHVPQLCGTRTIDKVTDAANGDISNCFMLDCCIVFERIPGRDQKLGLHALSRPHILALVKKLKALDVLFTDDISVFLPDDPDKFKIIDFGMRDPHLDEAAFCEEMQNMAAKKPQANA